jgi:tetratricopeptide (TPR) repeat protein
MKSFLLLLSFFCSLTLSSQTTIEYEDYENVYRNHMASNNLAAAEQDLNKMWQLMPENCNAPIGLITLHLKQNQFEAVSCDFARIAAYPAFGFCEVKAIDLLSDINPDELDQFLQPEWHDFMEKWVRLLTMTDSISQTDLEKYPIKRVQYNHVSCLQLLNELKLNDTIIDAYLANLVFTKFYRKIQQINALKNDSTANQLDERLRKEILTDSFEESASLEFEKGFSNPIFFIVADSLIGEAVKTQTEILSMATDKVDSLCIYSSLLYKLGQQSYFAVFAKKPEKTIKVAKEFEALYPKTTGKAWDNTFPKRGSALLNMAHGYLFTNQIDTAIALYKNILTENIFTQADIFRGFNRFIEGHIWCEGIPIAVAAILERPLTIEELSLYHPIK